MKAIMHRWIRLALIGVATLAMAGCATHHDRRAGNTMMGAGLGAAAGAVVSQGNPWYALGGAAAGGVLGHILTEDRDRRPRHWNHNSRSPHHAKHRGHHRHYANDPGYRHRGHHRSHHRSPRHRR